jgi:hypothetical protein
MNQRGKIDEICFFNDISDPLFVKYIYIASLIECLVHWDIFVDKFMLSVFYLVF